MDRATLLSAISKSVLGKTRPGVPSMLSGGQRSREASPQEQIEELEKAIKECDKHPIELNRKTCSIKFQSEIKALNEIIRENIILEQHGALHIIDQVLAHLRQKCLPFKDTQMVYLGRWKGRDAVHLPPTSEAVTGSFYILDKTPDQFLVGTAERTWAIVSEKDLERTPWGKQVDEFIGSVTKIRTLLLNKIQSDPNPTHLLDFVKKALDTERKICVSDTQERAKIVGLVDRRHARARAQLATEVELKQLQDVTKQPDVFFSSFDEIFRNSQALLTRKLENNLTEFEASTVAYAHFMAGVKRRIKTVYPSLDETSVDETYNQHIVHSHRMQLENAFPKFDAIPKAQPTLENANREIQRLHVLLEACGATARPPVSIPTHTSTTLTTHPPSTPRFSTDGRYPDLLLRFQEMEAKYKQDIRTLESRYKRLQDESERTATQNSTLSTKMSQIALACNHSDKSAVEDLAARFYNQNFTFKKRWVSTDNIRDIDQILDVDRLQEKVLVVRPMYRSIPSTKPLSSPMKKLITEYFNQRYLVYRQAEDNTDEDIGPEASVDQSMPSTDQVCFES